MTAGLTIVPARHHVPWSTGDIRRLRVLVADGHTDEAIAVVLLRTPEAVRRKVWRLGLRDTGGVGVLESAYYRKAAGETWSAIANGKAASWLRGPVKVWAERRGLPWPPALDIAEAAK